MIPRTTAVIIPAFNAEKTIGQTLASLDHQTRRPDAVIVVDDGSTDSTAALAAGHAGVRVLSKVNGGQGSARAAGSGQSSAELLLFLDADDLLEPEALEILGDTLAAAPDSPLAFCPASTFAEPGCSAESLPCPDDSGVPARETLLKGNFIRTPGCVLIRKSSLDTAGGWDPDPRLQGHEDWDLWLRLAELGPFARVDRPLLRYRLHPSGFSNRSLAMKRSYLATLRKTARIAPTSDPYRSAVSSLLSGARRSIGRDFRHAARSAAARHQWWSAARLAVESLAIDPNAPAAHLRHLFG